MDDFENIARRMHQIALEGRAGEKVRMTPETWERLRKHADENNLLYASAPLAAPQEVWGLPVELDPSVTDPRGFVIDMQPRINRGAMLCFHCLGVGRVHKLGPDKGFTGGPCPKCNGRGCS